MKKEELALLDDDDPAILHHTLSKLPSFATPMSESSIDRPPSPFFPPTDEDLMSTSHHSHSLSSSYLSLSTSEIDTDTDTDSLSALSDSMLSDPDVSGLAHFDAFPSASPPPSPPLPAPPISLDKLILRTLELSVQHPLVGPGGIDADAVLGAKSCVFTWKLSAEGRLDDRGAEAIAEAELDVVVSELVEESKEEKEGRSVRLRGEKRRRSRRKVELGVGSALTLVGVAGVLLAIYGGELRSGSFREWRLGSVSLGLNMNWSLIRSLS